MTLRPLAEPEHQPDFDLARKLAIVTAPPPFDFSGVTMRFFPLEADFLTLSKFCDNYLNISPEFALFRPAMPFVMFGIVNYGRMTMEAGNLGWTSQNEVLFSVPLEWYRPENGEWVFHDLAQVAPFIFVDNETSQIGGREVYGWPKVQGWFTSDPDDWSQHPRHPRRVFQMNTRAFKQLYAGNRLEPLPLLAIDEDPLPSAAVFPPDPNNPLNPAVGIPRAAAAWSQLFQKMAEWWSALPMQGYQAIDRRALPQMLQSTVASLSDFSNYQANTINLKQFRDSAQPGQYCYQALTNARMEITQLRQAGLLGDAALFTGDPSGGYEIRVHRYPSVPIVETLGLQVDRELSDGETDVACMRPVMPFWMEVDLRYLRGQDLCWRTNELSWRNERVEVVPDPDLPETERQLDLRYNTTGSAGLQVATGPFTFPEAVFCVLPLLATPEPLAAFCDAYLNGGRSDGENRFEPWGRYVYMVVRRINQMSSETNNMGLWADTQVEFALPVRWIEKGQVSSAGFVAPFMFTNSSISATTGREVNGWATVEAAIGSQRLPWLSEQGPFADETGLLQLDTDVFPALGVGQRSEWRRLIEVVDGNLIAWNDRPSWNQVAEGWGRETKADLEHMAQRARASKPEFDALRALALEVLGNRQPINQLSLKQFRDAEDPNKACYQAIVRSSGVITRIHDIRELEKRIHVKIHRYPTQPIVDTLGLVVQSRIQGKEAVVDVLQPARPFYMKLDLETRLGEKVCWRAGSTTWRSTRSEHTRMEPPYFSVEDPVSGGSRGPGAVSRALVASMDQHPQRIRDRLNHGVGGAEPLTRVEAARALSRHLALEPQMAVQAMLSAEWENWGDPRWNRKQRRLPYFVVRRDSVGMADEELFSPPCRSDGSYWTPDDDLAPPI